MIVLFAQRMMPDGPDAFSDEELLQVFCLFVIWLAIDLLFLLTLSKALRLCRPANRVMHPGLVWLNLIPRLGFLWLLVTVQRVGESLRNEFRSRGLPPNGVGGLSVGRIGCILNLLMILPVFRAVALVPALICFLIYWIKIAIHNRTLLKPFVTDDEPDHRWEEAFDREEDDRGDRPALNNTPPAG